MDAAERTAAERTAAGRCNRWFDYVAYAAPAVRGPGVPAATPTAFGYCCVRSARVTDIAASIPVVFVAENRMEMEAIFCAPSEKLRENSYWRWVAPSDF